MSFRQMVAIFLAHWKTIGAIFLLTLATTAVVTYFSPRQYEAHASFVLESKDALYGGANPVLNGAGYINTQLAIFSSERVARRVVRELRLTDDPALRDRWRESTGGGLGGAGDIEAWTAQLLMKSLNVEPAGKSNVIDVKYKGVEPSFAAQIANAFVQAYIDTSRELRVDPAKQTSGFFDVRVKQYREQLELAQSRLTAFQNRTGITVTDEKLDVETARLNALSGQMVNMQAILSDSTSRQAQARSGSADQLSDIMLHPVVAALKADVTRQEVALQQMSTRLGDNHPQVVEAKASLAELRRRFDGEVRRATGSVGVNNSINRQREADVSASFEAQRAKVLRLKGVRDEMTTIQRDVENAQRIYDSVLGRLTASNLESQNTLSYASVLNPAVAPTEFSSPRIMKNMIFATVLGGMLALATGLLLEFLDRKVRSIEDVSRGLGLPVIGVMPSPDRARWIGGHAMAPLLARRVLGQLPGPQ